MQVVNIEQNTPEWLKWREEGVGASDVPVIMGASPYKSKLQLWLEKTGRKPPTDLTGNPHIRRGHEEEPYARAEMHNWLKANKNRTTEIPPICGQHDSYDFMRVSFDGVPTDGELTPCELKCPCEKTYKEIELLAADSPTVKMYLWQLVYQMLVAKAKVGYLAFYLKGSPLIVFEHHKDVTEYKQVFEAVSAFWVQVQDDTPPKGELLTVNTPEWTEAALNWSQAKANEKAASAKKKEAEEQLKSFHSDAGFYRVGGCGVEVVESTRMGSIDYKAAFFALAEKAGITPSKAELMAERFRKDDSVVVSVKESLATDEVTPTCFDVNAEDGEHAIPFCATF